MKELEYTGEFPIPNKTPYIAYQEHMNRYAFVSNFVKDKTALDVGCGTGYGASYLRRKGARLVVCGDISRDVLEYADAHYSRDGLYFVCLDATSLPFPSGSFEVIVSVEIIEHLKEYKRYLSECERVLKPGGVFICTTPNRQVCSPHTEKPLNAFHFHEFCPEEFCTLIGGISQRSHYTLSIP